MYYVFIGSKVVISKGVAIFVLCQVIRESWNRETKGARLRASLAHRNQKSKFRNSLNLYIAS